MKDGAVQAGNQIHGGRVAPGPPGHPLFGNTPGLRRAAIRILMDSWREYGDVVRLRLGGPWVGYLFAHPDHVQRVLQQRWQSYPKVPWYQHKLRGLVGEGLLTSEGETWRRQRRLTQPAFHRERIDALGRIMTDATRELLDRWEGPAARGERLNAASEMMRLTVTIVARALLGSDVAGETERIGQAVTVGIEHTFQRMESYFDLPGRLPLPSTRRFERARDTLDAIIYRIIDERRRASAHSDDLVSLLLQARDEETGEGMTDEQLRDEMLTIFMAGHETTAVTLSWAWYLLSRHPEIRSRLEDELAGTLAGRTPTVEDLPRLPYTSMVVQESMRLFPPAWALSRVALEDDEVGGYHIPRGALVYVCPYVTHRHPSFWDNPEGVDPERFTPERAAVRPRFAYFPFGGGPRQCIGNSFALVEAQLVLATIAQAYRLDLVPGQSIALDPKITLRPRHGILVTLRRR